MRRPISAWTTAILGTALSASTLSAQQAPTPPAAAPAPAPASAPAVAPTTTRGARYLMRNGWDYIKIQEYERALTFFREAEKRQSDLNDQEKADLRQGIDEAQRGLRVASSAVKAGVPSRPVPPHSRDSFVMTTGATAVSSGLPALPVGPALAETSPAPLPSSRVPAPQGVTGPPALEGATAPDNGGVEPALPPLPPDSTGNATDPAQEPINPPLAPELAPTPVTEAPMTLPPLPDMPELAPAPPVRAPIDAHVTPAAAPPSSTAPPPSPEPLPPLPDMPDQPVPTPAPATEASPPATAPAASADAGPPVVVPTPAPEMPAPAQAPTAPLAPALAAEEAPAPRVIPSNPPPAAAPGSPQPPLAAPRAPQPSLPGPSPTPEPQPRPEAPATAPATTVRPSASAVVVPEEYNPAQSTLAPHLQRQVDEIAQRQDEQLRRDLAQPRPIPGPDAPMAPPPGVNRSTASQLDISRAPSPTEARPIRAIPVPENFVPMARRDWAPNRKYWSSGAVCHMPLYFQDAALERYGHNVERFAGPAGRFLTYPIDDPKQSNQRNQILQPIFSIGLFAFQTAMLPYNLIVDPPWEAEYDLGYYRPGDRVPDNIIYLPMTGVGPPLQGKNY